MSDADTSTPDPRPEDAPPSGPLYWLVVAVLVAVALFFTVREERVTATVVFVVVIVAVRAGWWLGKRLLGGRGDHRA